MNPPKITPSVLMFAGVVFDGRDAEHPFAVLQDGSKIAVRVRIVPARHLVEPTTGFLDLYEMGKEAQVLEMCVQVSQEGLWPQADPVFIDNLNEETHTRLYQAAESLNFQRAVSQAERAIARGEALRPMKKRFAETMMSPMVEVLESWTSSLTSRISDALGGKKL